MAEEIIINKDFERALHHLQHSKKPLFITGKAGTGKSTLLNYFMETTTLNPVVLAPTGVAALNVKGQTIHSFFNFYVDVTPEKVRDRQIKPRDRKLYKNLNLLIIDEISMVRADLLDCVETFLKLYGPHPGEPFGGVKMVFVGDMYQLPPVVSGAEQSLFQEIYDSPYFFSAECIKDTKLDIIELEDVYRQKDPEFITLLNQIRNNSIDEAGITLLNQRLNAKPEGSEFFITLTTTNKKALEINHQKLEALPDKTYLSQAHIEGSFSKEYFPTETDLQFKMGAQVMMLNNDSKKRWVNGTLGVIESLNHDADEKPYLKIRLQDSGKLIDVHPFTWEVFKFSVGTDGLLSEAVGTFTQYPFRLAWAITIHKSQGKTFDSVTIDLERGAFAHGQVYVALSRCRTLEGISMASPLKKSSVRTDPRIYKYLTQAQYNEARETLSLEDLRGQIEGAIKGKETLKITYLKANDTKTIREIRPYSLGAETYQGKTFEGIRALCTKAKEDRMFRLDRILKIHGAGE